MKVGVIGCGMVGRQMVDWFVEQHHEVLVLDPAQGKQDELSLAHVVFVCVPTPERDGSYDLSAVEDAFTHTATGQIVVLRSTVLPGTTEKLQQDHPDRIVLFCPEFLTERRAKADVRMPARTIVGYVNESHKVEAGLVIASLPEALYESTMPAREAEAVKLFSNAFYALKVAYANQFYDYCKAMGIDYETIREAASNDPMMGAEHLQVWLDGYRGFGGKCLPKDTRALYGQSKGACSPIELLGLAIEYNDGLRARDEKP
jgi:UDPglucose 6-dehydrogenase